MKYILETTLQHLVLVKLAKDFWNRKDIRKLIKNCNFFKDLVSVNKKWGRIEDQVAKHVANLQLPKPLKRNLVSLIKPIGHQIKAWCRCHREECQALKLPSQFLWTTAGSIDRKRTAEMLVKDEDIDVDTRYELACLNCLEEKIPELWNRIPEQQKIQFQSTFIENHLLVKYWTCKLVGQLPKLTREIENRRGQSNLHVYALHCGVLEGNLAATEFFLDKLSDEERDTLLVRSAETATLFHGRSVHWSDVFHYLLTRMTEDQQMRALTYRPTSTLSCFLDWPYQPFFMVSAQHTVRLKPEDEHVLILESIAYKLVQGWTDFDYRQLFHDYQKLIPFDYKNHSIRCFKRLFELFECGERGILKSLFNYSDVVEKERFVLSGQGRELCVKMVEKERWRQVEWLIELCGSSKVMMVEFKEVMIQYKDGEMARHLMSNVYQTEDEYQRKWFEFFQFLDDLIEKKRKHEDHEN